MRHLPWAMRLVVALLAACVAAPVVVAYLRMRGTIGSAPTWTAFGDAAYLALRSLDVTNGHLPLIGSQSSVEGSILIMQPGPAQFYAQAPFTSWLGGDVGSLVFAGLTTALAGIGCMWVALRRFGMSGAVVGTAVVLAVEAQLGLRALVDSISSTHGQLPMLFAALATVMAVAGDRRLFPAAVVALSYALQVHLSFVGYGLTLGPLLAVVLVVGVAQALGGDRRWFLRWAAAGVICGAVMWAPPVLDQLFDSGNLGNIITAGSGEGGVEGVPWNDRELASALAAVFGPVPALLAPTEAPLAFEYFGLSLTQTLVGLAMGATALVLGVALAVWGPLRDWLSKRVDAARRYRGRGRAAAARDGALRSGGFLHRGVQSAVADTVALRRSAAGMVLVSGVSLALVGALFASQLRGPAVFKPNNNRWMVVTGAVVWLGALVAPTVSVTLRRSLRTAARGMTQRARVVAAVVATVLLLAPTAGASVYLMTRPLGTSISEPWLGRSAAVTDDVVGVWGDRGPVRLYSPGANSAGGMQPAVMLGLEQRGIPTQTVGGLEALRAGYGKHRQAEGEDPPFIQIQDGDIELPAEGTMLRAIIARQVQGNPTRYQQNVGSCLERAQRAGEAVTITDWGRKVMADPDVVGSTPLDQLLVEGLRRPQLLFLADLAPQALRRGYIEPIEVNVCSPEYQRELASGLFMTVWLVE
ncbi:MAG: hypothetical protein R2754_02725 [Microthrixaceae bacterium]